MNKRLYLFVMMLTALAALTNCTSKEEKALTAAIQSKQTARLRQFIKECPAEKTQWIDSARVVLAEWEHDSADYYEIKQIKDVVKRAGAEITYMDHHFMGLYIDSVCSMYVTDGPEADAIIARREAIDRHLEPFRKQMKDIVFYRTEGDNWRHIVMLDLPDEEGKGRGMYLYLPTNANWAFLGSKEPFTYSINLEDFNDDDISCRWDDGNGLFIIELYNDKSLYMTNQGELRGFMGERDPETYHAVFPVKED